MKGVGDGAGDAYDEEQDRTLRVRFSVFEDVAVDGEVGDGVDLDAVRRVFAEEIAALEADLDVERVDVQESDAGVGFSVDAFELVVLIEAARQVLDDLDRLVTWGERLRGLIERVRRRSGSGTTVSDSTTLGALAASHVAPSTDLVGRRLLGSQRLNGAGTAPDETDERHVWASIFESEDGSDLLVVFLSSDGTVFGQVLVPVRLRFGGRDGYELLSGEKARRLFREWNGGKGAAPS